MNASKLMKVTYFDPKSDIRLLCYADTVVWDTKPAPTLIALRFGGYPERVQGLADAIYGGATIEIEDDNATYSLMTLPKQYRREVSRDGVYAEATLIAEDDGQNASRPSGKKEDTTQEDAPSDEEFEQVEQDLHTRRKPGAVRRGGPENLCSHDPRVPGLCPGGAEKTKHSPSPAGQVPFAKAGSMAAALRGKGQEHCCRHGGRTEKR